MKDLKVFIAICHGTDKDGDSYDETIDRVFITEDQACEHLMKMKRDWLEENKCITPVMLTDKFNQFSLYIHSDDPREYAGHVKEISLLGLNKLDSIQRYDIANVLFNEPFASARYAIQVEIECFISEAITDKQMQKLVDMGIELYENHDYATPVGVGCSIGNYLSTLESQDAPIDYDSITYEALQEAYYVSDWR
jgi:hypothetical protein